MFPHNSAYRFTDGSVEGFTGFALGNSAMARMDAIRKIRDKISMIQTTNKEQLDFDEFSMIASKDILSESELKTVQSDWITSSTSRLT